MSQGSQIASQHPFEVEYVEHIGQQISDSL